MGCLGSKEAGKTPNGAGDPNQSKRILKLIVVGSSGAGKSCFVYRGMKNEFTPELNATIVAEPFITEITLGGGGEKVRAEIWDTVGLDKHRTTTPSAPIYRKVDGCFLTFDITSKESFEQVEKWYQEVNIKTNAGRTKYVLMGAKSDLGAMRAVSKEEAQALVTKLELDDYVETSSKTDDGVQVAYEKLAAIVKDMRDKEDAGNLL